jgi:autotransporter-associated beta strand protein
LTLTASASYSTRYKTPVTGTLATPSGGTEPYSYSNTTPQHGTLTISGTSFTYTPGVFHGSDSFDYTVTDHAEATATETITLTVSDLNDISDESLTLTEVDANAGTFDNAIINPTGSAATLTFNLTTADETFSGNITETSGHPISIVKTGDEELTLSGTNTLTGPITIDEGALKISSAANLGQASIVNLKSGTLHITQSITSTVPVRLGGN